MAELQLTLIGLDADALTVSDGREGWTISLRDMTITTLPQEEVTARPAIPLEEAGPAAALVAERLVRAWMDGRAHRPRRKEKPSDLKKITARENGKKGGRPRKTKKGEEK